MLTALKIRLECVAEKSDVSDIPCPRSTPPQDPAKPSAIYETVDHSEAPQEAILRTRSAGRTWKEATNGMT